MKDCTIQLSNNPGDLARVTQALSRRGVNVKAIAAMTVNGAAVARILPDDIVAARAALEGASMKFTESEVHTVLLENKAGVLSSVASRLGEQGINIEAIYTVGAAEDLIEIGVVSDDPKKTKKTLEEF